MPTPASLVLPWLLLPATLLAQAGLSQANLEADCLRRLRVLMPPDVKVRQVGFSALGNSAAYYVVSAAFTGALTHGRSTAACTYRRDGEWVRDDAWAHRTAGELEARRPKQPR
ncbi:MAG TPA: hypothetical protein VIL30_14660 [Ramlibacter sp.]